MSQANLPNITPSITLTRTQALNLLLGSIALEELGRQSRNAMAINI
ncbi:hypothetical protein M3215_00305 [Bacillus cytotoxicus]|uniref:Uncharacterized protein n=1 Tax=Bacillus cytotoxicus TaxID=580165 RepID=A0ACC6A0A8_9BACI|nr:hypothetical protein [Bacillus cytotoxicus]HDX9578937.1 hypothetical protein [Bacillus pseudomycoides]